MNLYSFLVKECSSFQYFRLKQKDFDGGINQSSIVKTELTDFNSFNITISPNPVNDQFKVLFKGLKNEIKEVVILDNLGKEDSGVLIRIINSEELEIKLLNKMNKGLYILRFTLENDYQIIKKIIINE
jgi:hypothetical protein